MSLGRPPVAERFRGAAGPSREERQNDIAESASNDGRDQLSGLGLHPRHHMRILLQRERRRLVPESFADDLDRDAGLYRDGRVGVAEVVQPDPS